MTKRPSRARTSAALPADYAPLLADIKARVLTARIKAGLAANRELLALYWDIGRLILDRQKKEGWGTKVIDRLSTDLQKEFPGQQGFSPRNLKYMRAFAEAWPETVMIQQPVGPLLEATLKGAPIVQQPAAQLTESKTLGHEMAQAPLAQSDQRVPAIVHQPGAQLPWYHHCVLLDKLETPLDRLWYAAKAIEHGWSRNVLALQIGAGLHDRQGKAVTNFSATLPPALSDLAQGITKDPYLFDFLLLRDDANERAVEEGLVVQVEKFLLELGAGFALVGRQVHLEVGGQDFYLDLLFYHLKLRCYIVIDLKARDFTPEAAGKMNPMRYQHYESILLRVCSAQSQRRQSLRWRNGRFASEIPATPRWQGAIHSAPLSARAYLLRGVPCAAGCVQAGKISENRLGQTLPQDAARKLSHGVNFYLSAVDDRHRQPGDQPSIGLILCRNKNRVIAEYALRDLSKPIGVSGYVTKLVDDLPKAFQGAVPTVAELEKGLAQQ
ncbi:MAG: PDDEXK nuclease domain-containing protein [Lacunisphaera sp.]|nr:PDDEXK nuclease domain-containing protein [Lacunisphaera sp.]